MVEWIAIIILFIFVISHERALKKHENKWQTLGNGKQKGRRRRHKVRTCRSMLNGTDYYVPPACRGCSNHPSNGGSGICHCTLGGYTIT